MVRPQHDWRKIKERMLGIVYAEDEEKKKVVARMISRKDKELREREEEIKSLGVCPKCRMVRLTTGKCSMDCS